MAPSSAAAPILCVQNIPASIARYAQAFGFEARRYFDGNDGYAVLTRGEAQVHLFRTDQSDPHHRHDAHVADVFVWVDDLDAVVASATAAGLRAERGPEHYDSTPVATTEVVYPDLDGNWLCFGQAD